MNQSDRRRWGTTLRLAASGIALLLLVLFIALNFVPVEVRLLVTDWNTRLAWALLAASMLGFVAGYFWPRRS